MIHLLIVQTVQLVRTVQEVVIRIQPVNVKLDITVMVPHLRRRNTQLQLVSTLPLALLLQFHVLQVLISLALLQLNVSFVRLELIVIPPV
jgi:hypothetical protein